MRPRLASLVGLGFALLLVAWVLATPPFHAPDEVFHYLRAAGISNGEWLGPKVHYSSPALSPAQLAWAQQSSRGVRVSAALAPPGVLCLSGQIDTSSCVEPSTVGNYHPLPYLLPALAIDVADNTDTALWLARAGSALLCGAFILLAIALLWNGTAWSLVGLLAAVTPMALFVASVINPNGLEIAASLGFAAAVLRLSRAPARAQPWVWAALAVSGVAAVLAWQLGPVFVAADVLLLAGLLGRSGLRELGGRARGAPIWAGGAIACAVLVWFVYGAISGVEHSHLAIGFPTGHGGFAQLRGALRQAIGDFGYLNVPLPATARWLWWVLVLALLAVALWLGATRERILVIVVTALCLAFPVLFYVWVYRFSGFGLQGRYMLPVLMLIPLTAGEIASRRSHLLSRGRGPRLVLGGAVALIAILQGYAWWYSASASAAGKPGQLGFFGHPSWQPPLGWAPWIAAALLGVAALLAFGIGAALRSPRRRAIHAA